MGTSKLVTEKKGFDVGRVYARLIEKYPGMLDPGVTDPAEQLTGILNKAKALSENKKLKVSDIMSDDDIRRVYADPAFEELKSYYSQKPRVAPPLDRDSVKVLGAEGDELYGEVGRPLGFGEHASEIKGSGALEGTFVGMHGTVDLDRNLDRFLGTDTPVRSLMDENFTRPFFESKGVYANSVINGANDLWNVVAGGKKGGLGIKPRSRESNAVMWIGEGQRQLRDGRGHVMFERVPKLDGEGNPVVSKRTGKVVTEDGLPLTEKYTEADLKREFPASWEKIKEAEKYMRGVYDKYIAPIQAHLKEKYPDVEKNVERIRAKGAKERIVIGDTVRSDAAGAVGVVTDISPEGWYEITFRNKKAGTETTAALNRSEFMLKRRYQEIEDEVRGKRLFPRDDYFHHTREMKEGNVFTDIGEIFRSATLIDPRLVSISESTKPKTRFTGFLQRRKGGEYSEDAVTSLLEYIIQAEYKLNIEPHISTLRTIGREVAGATVNSKNANSFLEFVEELAGELAGKTAPLDRAVLKALGNVNGRRFLNFMMKVSHVTRGNAVAGNVRTILVQSGNLPNVFKYAGGDKKLAKAAVVKNIGLAASAALGQSPGAKAKLALSNALRERFMGRAVRKFDRRKIGILDEAVARSMEFFDEWVADAAFLTFFDEAVARGLDETAAAARADILLRKSIGGRGIGEMPQMQRAKLTKIAFPFQVESQNDLNLMIEGIGEKAGVDMLSLFGARALLNAALGTLGISVAIDPITTAVKSVMEGRDSEMSAGDIAKQTAGRVAGNVISNMPYGSYFADGLKNTLNVSDTRFKDLFYGEDPSRFGTGNMSLQSALAPVSDIIADKPVDLLTPATAFLPPYGGAQIKRTVRGLQDMNVLPGFNPVWDEEGERVGSSFGFRDFPSSRSAKGNLRFPVEPTAGNYIKSGLLGSFSTPEGKEYLESGAAPLSGKQTSKVEEAYRSAYAGDPYSVPPDVASAIYRERKDADESGQVSNREATAYILKLRDRYGLSQEQMFTLWKMMTGGGTAGNPFR
jgi:hypothetical protein